MILVIDLQSSPTDMQRQQPRQTPKQTRRQPGLVVPRPKPSVRCLEPWEEDARRERAGKLPRWRKAELGLLVGVTQALTWLMMPTPFWPLAVAFCGVSFYGAKVLADEQFQAIDKAKRLRGELPPLPSPGDLVDWPDPAPSL